MNKGTDPLYLLMDQYCDASNLDVRAELHRRFSTNTYEWHLWVFDQFELAESSCILELGCGPGWLWQKNLDRISTSWEITLSDFSSGMVDEAEQHLKGKGPFQFDVIDAQSTTFPDEHFDAVIANHMLYHVPNRPAAIKEMHRVLKPGGQLYVATNGEDHMREYDALVLQVLPGAETVSRGSKNFSLQNGADQLSPWFPNVSLHTYEDALVITEAEPLVQYLQSMAGKMDLDEVKIESFKNLVDAQLKDKGAIHVTKSPGLFKAIKPGGLA